ncbi:hypothetical protein, partial [Salmonella enterica]|uniref:hypothetical protein n=1 Tax=Salmonella enterica TaxID=28901 RepID=UPI003524B8A2
TTTVDGVEYVLRTHSVPTSVGGDGNLTGINRPRLVEGRMPNLADECVIESNRNVAFPLSVGDTISVASGTTTDISATLVHSSYRIVGKVVSPLYLTFDHGESSVGGGRINLFMLVGAGEFLYPVYT